MKVTVAEKLQGGWKLELESVVGNGHTTADGKKVLPLSAQRTITCAKLAIATGLTSVQQPIKIKGSENFQVPIVNFGDYPREAEKIYEDEAIKNVTVIGGGKADYNIVYLMAAHGKQIT